MQQHLISTVSLLVAASSAILAIIFFAVYLILRVKNGTKEQPEKKVVQKQPAGTVDLLAPPEQPVPEQAEPVTDHFKQPAPQQAETHRDPPAEPARTPEEPSAKGEEEKAEIKLSYEDVLRKYFNE